ncbi:MAG: hypothetical protein ABSF60_08650 [Verrucomicrobiota bacterium]
MQPTNDSTADTNIANQNTPIAMQPNAVAQPNATSVTNSDELRRMKVLQQFVEKHNAAVQFFGKVVDQDNNALAGANIKISINHLIMPPAPFMPEVGSKYIDLEKTSDAEGRFEIHGETGKGIGIGTIVKDGYELEPNRYGYGPIAGSYDNPVIFKMWRTNIHEQLITGDKSFEIMPDGQPYFINLTDGTISEHESGNLKVWIRYTNQVVQGQLYDWSAGIEVINGGLLEVPQTAINSGFLGEPPFAMYSAPQDGYIPSFSQKSQIKGGQSGEIGNRYFYLLLNNGKEYGKMSINLFAPYGDLHPGLIRLSYAINPSGSRILR